MNCTSALNSGIVEAVLEYGASNNVELPHVTSPTADRVSSTILSEAVSDQALALYHNALEQDMQLYFKLLPEEHRPAVEHMVSAMLRIGRNWKADPRQNF